VRDWIRRSPVSAGVALVAVGFALIFLAWNGAAGRDFVEGQLPYLISGGLTGLALVGTGLTVALVQAQRREARAVTDRLDELIEVVRANSASGAAGPTLVPDESMVIAGRSSFHLPSCRLVQDRDDLQPMSPTAAEQRGLAPCRICKPDTEAQALA
jgi:hypothetical protein